MIAMTAPHPGRTHLGAVAAFALLIAALPLATAAQAADQPASWGLLQRCAKCHNSEDWAGGIAFETMSPQDIPADAETWEKAVRKLRGRLMPPPGQSQPDQHSIDAFVSWMEGELDRAAAQPDPGNVGLHRLNRTEYVREINRILGLNVDVSTMLPTDVSSGGFDNIAAVLKTSPAFLDQYITAARNISRQAVGRASSKSSSHEYRVRSNLDQTEHIDGLPLGTRGGFVLPYYFPADGEYVFNIRNFFFGGAGYITKIDHEHRVILTIDGVRVFQGKFGGPEDLKAVDQRQATAADEMQARFNGIRVRVPAGEHRVGVAFIQRSFAESDSPLQPIAELPEFERTPGIPGLDISGPFDVSGVGDTESRRRIFICRPASAAEEEPCARRILSQLATQAFRRPITEDELAAPLRFYQEGRATGDFDAGIESGLTAILSSTRFLFRAEPAPAGTQPGSVFALNDYELASRLSFFIWSQGPDEALTALASSGQLHDAPVLAAQVHRMLADPRSETLVTNFAFQWLAVSKIDSIQPDPTLYPNFDQNLRESFREEMRQFLDSVLRADRSVLDLLDSDQTFLNERLARHYGVPNIQGAQFREVRLTNPDRFGLLGKGALLMGTSYGNRTSPVLRGAFVLENLIGTPPNPPPPGVDTNLTDPEAGRPVHTVRERLERHRTNPSCNACHGIMDPLGFALENFDVVGAWRDRDIEAGVSIDASGQLADGTQVASPTQLRRALDARPDQFVQTLSEKLMTFALGRILDYRDMPTVRAITRDAAGKGYRFEAIVQGVVASPQFRMRHMPAAAAQPTIQARN